MSIEQKIIKLIKRIKKMSLISDKATEIANQLSALIADSSTIADAIQADINTLKETIAQKDLEIEQLQNTLANIGTIEQMTQIFTPVQTKKTALKDKLNTIEQGQ